MRWWWEPTQLTFRWIYLQCFLLLFILYIKYIFCNELLISCWFILLFCLPYLVSLWTLYVRPNNHLNHTLSFSISTVYYFFFLFIFLFWQWNLKIPPNGFEWTGDNFACFSHSRKVWGFLFLKKKLKPSTAPYLPKSNHNTIQSHAYAPKLCEITQDKIRRTVTEDPSDFDCNKVFYLFKKIQVYWVLEFRCFGFENFGILWLF